MNTRNDWKNTLKLANEDLGKRGCSLNIVDEDGCYYCDILKDGEVVETYAGGYYENELEELIADAWTYTLLNVDKKEYDVQYGYSEMGTTHFVKIKCAEKDIKVVALAIAEGYNADWCAVTDYKNFRVVIK